MNSEIRIPTLLGLGVLIMGLVGAAFLVSTNQVLKTRASQPLMPQEVTVFNQSANRISIYWQTQEETTGFVQAGPSPSLGLTFRDDRDPQSPEPHKLHLVTLTGLTPNTTYYYKIQSGSTAYPSGEALSFTTISPGEPSNLPPIIGTSVDSTLQPASEALITLKVPGAQTLATITKMAGNFILPLTEIYNQELTGSFNITAHTTAELTVSDSEKQSKVILTLPQDTTLPPIILGKNLDLTAKEASPSSTNSQYDLNNDGIYNALDASIIIKNLGKNPKDKRADLNGDGVVDQKDVDIINQFIPKTAL